MNMHKKACVLVFRKLEGRIDLLRLLTIPKRGGMWAHVTGSVDPGEEFVDGAIRELQEETGLHLPVNESSFEHRFVDRFDRSVHEKVYWAILERDLPISLDGKEHTEFEWTPLESIGPQSFGQKSHFEAFIQVLREVSF
jgi:8-oxo-dGTP pyrophosphatase MutT (NUDIX family)